MEKLKTLRIIVLMSVVIIVVPAAFLAYVISHWEYPGCFSLIRFSKDGSKMLTRVGGGNYVILWDVNTGSQIHTFRGVNADDISFHPDGNEAVIAGGNGVFATAAFYNVDTGELFQSFEVFSLRQPPFSDTLFEFSPDGRYILFADAVESITLWNTQSHEKERVFQFDSDIENRKSSRRINSIRFSPDGRFAVSAGDRLILWDVATGQILRILKRYKNQQFTKAIITEDGQCIESGSGETLQRWSIQSGEEMQILHLDHYFDVICFTPDGKFAITGVRHFNVPIEVWDMTKGCRSFSIPTPESSNKGVVALSTTPDSRKIAIGLCGQIELWDIASQEKVIEFSTKAGILRILLDTFYRWYFKI